ncbi:MAG: mechanosensitive ion channel family protein [Rhodospirillales bacterium]|nr:mechanosensitive ion channel family protein [Rhodospirillales bacterium]MBO6785964.1 mechanosensitive ion channel family protein [Rhodospirillales bacterium]
MDKNIEGTVGEHLDTVSKYVDLLVEFGIEYGFQILGALVFLLIGLKVASWIGGRVTKMLEGRNVDVTLARFIGNVVKIVCIVFLVIITLGNFGVSIAPLIALAGAGAFGATVAVQGPLSNYGAGVSIILSRPFVVGNTITINKGASGVVEEITLAHTTLIGEDGEKITVPNKEIVGQIIVNSETRRVVQTKIAIKGGQDIAAAKSALRAAADSVADIADGPAPEIGVHDFTYGGIVLGIRFWVPSSRYFELRYTVNEAALEKLGQAGIELMAAAPTSTPVLSLSADDDETAEDRLL